MDRLTGFLHRAARRTADRTGVALGALVYRLEGRRPPVRRSDDALADVLRAHLRLLGQNLDVSRLDVTVEGRVALVVGTVGNLADAAVLDRAIAAASNVLDVEPYVHIEVAPASDTSTEPSPMSHREPSMPPLRAA